MLQGDVLIKYTQSIIRFSVVTQTLTMVTVFIKPPTYLFISFLSILERDAFIALPSKL